MSYHVISCMTSLIILNQPWNNLFTITRYLKNTHTITHIYIYIFFFPTHPRVFGCIPNKNSVNFNHLNYSNLDLWRRIPMVLHWEVPLVLVHCPKSPSQVNRRQVESTKGVVSTEGVFNHLNFWHVFLFQVSMIQEKKSIQYAPTEIEGGVSKRTRIIVYITPKKTSV